MRATIQKLCRLSNVFYTFSYQMNSVPKREYYHPKKSGLTEGFPEHISVNLLLKKEYFCDCAETKNRLVLY